MLNIVKTKVPARQKGRVSPKYKIKEVLLRIISFRKTILNHYYS